VDTGSRQESASKQKAFALIQSQRKRLSAATTFHSQLVDNDVSSLTGAVKE
jgi:hypothetical protein